MKMPLKTKIYSALALSLVIVPIFYFMLPVSHDDWWIGFRIVNHALRALSPLITIVGCYALFVKHKRYAHYLISVSLVVNSYLFNLDSYNLLMMMKSALFSQFNLFRHEAMYIGLSGLLVFAFTIFFNTEIIVKNNSEANQVI